jgi:hypothetical protein
VSAHHPGRLFLLAATLVLGAAALLAHARPTSEPSHAPAVGAPSAPAAPDVSDAPPAPAAAAGSAPPNLAGGWHERRAAGLVARRFVRALLQLEQRRTAPRLRRALATTARPVLARSLLGRPPHGRPAAAARLGPVELYGPFAGQIKASAWIARPGYGAQLLEVMLVQRAGSWRVARVRP